ncbi:hypothetical protein SAMN05660653_03060 [Desulfonatronum thiosulfatophilum]|uniref:Uncharacterized protein n=1 Tax=Desulfonatronum thiosulfatophilum TaxID=617002 RepID=A0A1G6EQP4_9BACT|nr:hypothetical protein [Desulfonatronum thiosulfatophilum]SDB59879.1 hypothetical protein SAMN05660653_03060 [Desulfonatronum thiosulfatophilum]
MRFWSPGASTASGSARAERFRSQNRIDDQVSGNFLGWEGQGLGWVDFQGISLLASMASRPDVGARLYFLVKQLSPEIVLQELLPRNLPGGYALLQRFWSVQTSLETVLAAQWITCVSESWDSRARIAFFRKQREQRPELELEYVNLQEALGPVNNELRARGKGRFFPMPWLVDRVQGAGLLLDSADSALTYPLAQFGCTHPCLGRMEIHYFHGPKKTGWLLLLEDAVPRTWTMERLKDCVPAAATPKLPFLGIKSLPVDGRSGILDRMLLTSDPDRFRLHLKV